MNDKKGGNTKMEIEKNDKIYSVRENKASWTLSLKAGRVEVSLNVTKKDCPTFESLKAFVAENEVF
jgi:hypothetical protein